MAAALILLASPAWAALKTVTVAIPGMTCSATSCKRVVTFDDAKTTVAALTNATTDAGYPSTVKGK